MSIICSPLNNEISCLNIVLWIPLCILIICIFVFLPMEYYPSLKKNSVFLLLRSSYMHAIQFCFRNHIISLLSYLYIWIYFYSYFLVFERFIFNLHSRYFLFDKCPACAVGQNRIYVYRDEFEIFKFQQLFCKEM